MRKKTAYDHEIALIRRAIKRECRTISVRRGRGTAYGWIEIRGSGDFGEFTGEEREALERLGLRYGVNFSVIPPDSRRFWVEKLAAHAGLEIPSALKEEYEERDRHKREMERRWRERRRQVESCVEAGGHFLRAVRGVVVFPSGTLYRCVRCGYEKVELD